MTRIVVIAYKPKPGKAAALKELTKTHVLRLKAEGLVTSREAVIIEAANSTVIEVFEWQSAELNLQLIKSGAAFVVTSVR